MQNVKMHFVNDIETGCVAVVALFIHMSTLNATLPDRVKQHVQEFFFLFFLKLWVYMPYYYSCVPCLLLEEIEWHRPTCLYVTEEFF